MYNIPYQNKISIFSTCNYLEWFIFIRNNSFKFDLHDIWFDWILFQKNDTSNVKASICLRNPVSSECRYYSKQIEYIFFFHLFLFLDHFKLTDIIKFVDKTAGFFLRTIGLFMFSKYIFFTNYLKKKILTYLHLLSFEFYVNIYFNFQVSKSCPQSIPTVTVVHACPKDKTEWIKAKEKKQCNLIIHNCTEKDKFQYHCLPNKVLDKLVEVCAPTKIIVGKIKL